MVAVRTGEPGSSGVSLVVLETENLSGFRVGRRLEKLGQHASDTAELFLDGVRLKANQLLGGQEGQGFRQLMSQLPYERLLLDVMAGDASRFMRRDAVEASWDWVTKILDGWAQQKLRWLPEYSAGTWGPVEGERMIQNDGRAWRIL